MKFKLILFVLAATSIFSVDGYKAIFDGETLSGWHSARSSEGDSYGVFSVDKDERAIHVYSDAEPGSNQPSDFLYTDADYSSFVLKLEYKWGEKRFAPRVDWDRDAGLLFHINGDLTKVWPESIEMQIGETPGDVENDKRYHTGDLYVLGEPLRAHTTKTGKFFDPSAPIVDVGTDEPWGSCLTKLGTERPHGEWNEIEIHVVANKEATYYLNGEKVLHLKNMEKKDGETYTPITRGRIGLQAEFAEIYYRNIFIKELETN